MAQSAQPRQDISEDDRMPAAIWPRNGAIVADTTVPDMDDPPTDIIEMPLSHLAFPGPGPQTLTVQLGQSNIENVLVTIALLQGNRSIASRVIRPTLAFSSYTLTLSRPQIAQITDYSSLRVRVSTEMQADVGGLPFAAFPRQWSLDVNGFGDACSHLNGNFILTHIDGFTWKSPNGIWTLIPFRDDRWELSAETMLGMESYHIPFISFNCLDQNTLSNSRSMGNSSPTTLTIKPV